MVDNKDPELTRKLQDVDGAPSSPKDDLYAVTSNRSFSVGRGGFGNMISRSRSTELPNEDVPNLYTVTSQPDKSQKETRFLG